MDNNHDVNLASIDTKFYNKTFKYLVNGFANACGMKDIEISPNSKKVIAFDDEGDEIYNISSDIKHKGLYTVAGVEGHYYNLSFHYSGMIRPGEDELLNKKERFLKFGLYLSKNKGEYDYSLLIYPEVLHYVIKFDKTNDAECTLDRVMIDTFIRSYDKVFTLISLFQIDPEELFETFKKHSSSLFVPGTVKYNRILNDEVNQVKERVLKKSK